GRDRGWKSNVEAAGNSLSGTEALRIVDGLLAKTRPSPESVRSLRAREASGRGGPRTDPRGPDARPRRSRQSPSRVPRGLLSRREQRDRDGQGAPPADPGHEPAPLQA